MQWAYSSPGSDRETDIALRWVQDEQACPGPREETDRHRDCVWLLRYLSGQPLLGGVAAIEGSDTEGVSAGLKETGAAVVETLSPGNGSPLLVHLFPCFFLVLSG